MSGFNKIMQVQPRTPARSSQVAQNLSMAPPPSPMNLATRSPMSHPLRQNASPSLLQNGSQRSMVNQLTPRSSTPNRLKQLEYPPRQENQHSSARKRSIMENEDPNISVDLFDDGSIPLKKRGVGGMFAAQNMSYREEFMDDELMPSNQLGLYPLDYDLEGEIMPETVQRQNETSGAALAQPAQEGKTITSTPGEKTKINYERVKEETIEMGGFVLPGSEKKEVLKSYNWIAGRADGQYRVVLGNNTLFKPKNPIDSKTGERDTTRWRVIRFENRYKENYPYTEFPARYLDTIINALLKAKEQYDNEIDQEGTN